MEMFHSSLSSVITGQLLSSNSVGQSQHHVHILLKMEETKSCCMKITDERKEYSLLGKKPVSEIRNYFEGRNLLRL